MEAFWPVRKKPGLLCTHVKNDCGRKHRPSWIHPRKAFFKGTTLSVNICEAATHHLVQCCLYTGMYKRFDIGYPFGIKHEPASLCSVSFTCRSLVLDLSSRHVHYEVFEIVLRIFIEHMDLEHALLFAFPEATIIYFDAQTGLWPWKGLWVFFQYLSRFPSQNWRRSGRNHRLQNW